MWINLRKWDCIWHGMHMKQANTTVKGPEFPAELFLHTVWKVSPVESFCTNSLSMDHKCGMLTLLSLSRWTTGGTK